MLRNELVVLEYGSISVGVLKSNSINSQAISIAMPNWYLKNYG
jgi:hypothetical protein